MFQTNPPTPKAMSDDELNAKIAEVQLQPDGLVLAMALIEEQSKLRQEDALALSRWQLEQQMEIASEPVSNPELTDPASIASQAPEAARPTPTPSSVSEPEIDIFAAVTKAPAASEPSASERDGEMEPVAQSVTDAPNHNDDPNAPAENIDDIVAALNASYVAVATETQEQVQITSQNDQEVQIVVTESVSVSVEELPAPVAAQLEENPATAKEQLEKALASEEPGSMELESSQDFEQLSATSKPSALVWAWLAVASTPATLLLSAFIRESGASLAQGIVLLASILLVTALLSAVGSMASAKASSSLTVVSRAGFGVWGNLAPASLMFLTKLVWVAVLLYLTARIISPLIFNQPWFASFASSLAIPAELTALLVSLVPILLLSSVVAGFGGVIMLRSQQVAAVFSIIGLGAFGYFVATSYSLQDLSRGEAMGASELTDLGILAMAFFAFTVFSLSGDFARKLPEQTPSSKVFFLSFVSTFFIPLIVGALGLMWLFMAGDTIASFTTDSLSVVAASAPMWVFVIFVVSLGLSLLQLISSSLYSLSGNLIGLVKIPSWASQLTVVVAVLATVLIPSYLVAVSVLQESMAELLLIAAVVASAWMGIVIADALARSRGYHEVSLTREYGFYGKANTVNLIGFVLAIVLGLGYLEGGRQLTPWAGYLGDLTPEIYPLAGSNIGVAMAFGLAALIPIVFGIPRIKKQERNLAELDQRRQELKEFLDGTL